MCIRDSYLIYLKRSFVTKSDGVYTGTGRRYNRHYYPMAYSVADSYFHAELMGKVPRTIDVLCSNRPTSKQPTRSRVVSWIHTYLEAHPDVRGIAGDVNSGGRREINDGYFGAMRKSKIVVTCNPSHWEGDFRTFEALASGALIFVDEMYVPHPRPFVDGEHVVVYDNSDEKAFAEKLAYYLAHPDEAAKIAAASAFGRSSTLLLGARASSSEPTEEEGHSTSLSMRTISALSLLTACRLCVSTNRGAVHRPR